MNTIEMIWRGSVLIVLGYFAWTSLIAGSILAVTLLLFCIPIWLFIGLYNIGYF